jgi:hypothetical protein
MGAAWFAGTDLEELYREIIQPSPDMLSIRHQKSAGQPVTDCGYFPFVSMWVFSTLQTS